MPKTDSRAVLFDLDGTLLNTLDDLADSVNAVLAAHGFPTHPAEAYKYFVGEGIRVLTIRALPLDRRSEEMIDGCMDEMRREYGRRYMDKTQPYPGIPDLLTWLQRNGIRMAVLSNKPHAFTWDLVAHLLGKWKFELVLGEGPDSPRKPDPAGARKVVEALGTDPPRILYLGDTATDMLTARAAGMFPVGVLWGFRSCRELQESGAREIIATPMELVRLLE